ncbi:hypothetical protein L7F22_023398 [Adiantum nelumboides]|nr:hypothetical protein [Adiantum nelumboides]
MAQDYLYRQQMATPAVCKEEFRGERTYAVPAVAGAPPPSESFYASTTATAPRPLAGSMFANPESQQQERLSELGAVAAAAFATYEEQKAKADPVQAYVQKLDADAARLRGIGSTGYGYNELRQKRNYDDGRWN